MNKSIRAYEPEDRVHRYDRDMDLLHPLRHKMLAVALETLPFPTGQALQGLDLGVGTGLFSRCLLDRFPGISILGVDGSETMIELAAERLAGHPGRHRFLCSRFESLPESLERRPQFDLIVSSYALHHLDVAAKGCLLDFLTGLLLPGGWFINADLVIAPDPEIEENIQRLRIEGILARNQGRDPRFVHAGKTRAFLDKLEANEGDQPITLAQDLDLLRASGIGNASLFWQEYREAVYGGFIPGKHG